MRRVRVVCRHGLLLFGIAIRLIVLFVLELAALVCGVLPQNPVSLQGFASGINLAGLTKGFGEEATVAVAWAHFLAQDLFIVSSALLSIPES